MTSAVVAHHSFAMLDTAHQIEISGVVKEFANPHSVWVVEVNSPDGTSKDWVV
jgi:Family of unknown function (DUF6152)